MDAIVVGMAVAALVAGGTALVVSLRTWRMVQVHGATTHLTLVREIVKDGTLLADIAAKKNADRGHKLSHQDKLRVAVEHALSRAKAHNVKLEPAEAARLIEVELAKTR